MLVLAFDTSTSRGGLALMQGGRLLAEYTLESPASYLNRLLPGIDRLLQDAGRSIQEVKLIVVSRGPGNFTGLRLGLSAAKGLALVLGCPVIAVNTLDVLAANFPFASLPVCTVIDAKKHEVYAGIYCQGGGGLNLAGDYLLLSPAALAERITEPTLITGPGLERYGVLWQELLGNLAILPPPELRYIRAAVLARLGLQQYDAGLIPNLEKLTPFYLRPADAELKRPASTAMP
ncbi:tRNA (adenosine(37)-N6)-threonylcarbamoyltransferase complex dimerization subunit type 1 TsaB [Desulfobacca acetoxidans]|nr:tRNA (adenosine(37)-N6)-threonylcarbamoyltransferase complex dimerization subunit type 1 TsaB [Desulfobacterales bacterium]